MLEQNRLKIHINYIFQSTKNDPDLNKKSDIKERFTQINQAYNQLKQRKFHKKVEEERQFDKISSAQSVEEFNDKYFDSTL
ncbi:unnamed protein product [Paramecium sonneborni]|uniref:J domain-containing protein n=1 Tax=Paramecium sonneborni TaxID=65129 RepID=A0A8S1R987_9CILI|nr:unnamed protein product [Paramecium sonneborni]